MNLFKIWKISAINANRNLIYTEEIETLKLVLNSSIFHLWDTHYTFSVFATLVFLNQLDRQSYDIKLIQTDEKLHYFHLTDSNRQIFFALINIQNVYSLQSSHYALMTRTSAIVVESMKIWHYHLSHLYVNKIIQLFKNFWISVKIKDTQTLFFCKACKLADLKKKLSIKIITKSQRHENKLHFNISDDNETLNKSNQLSQFFLDCKYFLIIIDNIIRMRWSFLMKSRNETYDILKYFLKQLKNQNIKFFVI